MSRTTVSILLIATALRAGILPYPTGLPSVTDSYDSVLVRTWEGIKKRSIDPYTIPLVHRPKSEVPHDAVSEGVGYGLLCALYCDDQEYFDRIWDAAETYMWAGEYYNWRVDREGNSSGMYWTGPATDAEEDIALALIFAGKLVERGHWRLHTSPKGATYRQRARTILSSLWTLMVEDGRYLRPGTWGGRDVLNPGYFAPAFYRVFDEFDGESGRNWQGLIDQCYTTAAASPGYERGLVPDWCSGQGGLLDQGPGYNAYLKGQAMYKDGIRTLWRAATDVLWYGEPRARALLEKALAFVGSPARANFYTVDGARCPETFTLGNGVARPRAEHSHLTVAMWATAAAAASRESADAFSRELLSYYDAGADYWGRAKDTAGEDTLHNEMYFDQFLAWFGAALLGGKFGNLWEILKDPDPTTPVSWITEPVLPSGAIDGAKTSLEITGKLSKEARWQISIRDSAEILVCAASGRAVDIAWRWAGLGDDGATLEPGWYTVTVAVQGLASEIEGKVWLGRSLDISVPGGLLVDDFADQDVRPYLGMWQSYLDSHEGKGGASVVEEFRVVTGSEEAYLRWRVSLDKGHLGFDPYAALQWRPPAGGTLEGLTAITFRARSDRALGVSVQLVTSDITDHNFFEDSVALTTRWQTFTIGVDGLKQRWGGARSIDPAALAAIRWQVQYPSGTTATIDIDDVVFLGSLGSLYSPPGPFVDVPESGARALANQRAHGDYRVIRQGTHELVIEPASSSPLRVEVYDLSGKLRHMGSTSSRVHFGTRQGCEVTLSAGVYCVRIGTDTGVERKRVRFLP